MLIRLRFVRLIFTKTTMANKPRVFMTAEIPGDGEGLRMLREACDVTIYDETKTGDMFMPRDEFLKAAQGVDGLMLSLAQRIDAEALDAIGPQLKVIGTQSVGLDHIDVAECARRNIPVGYTPDVLTDAVAEATVGLTLATARRHKEGAAAVLNGGWGSTAAKSLFLAGKEIKNSSVGIVGMGRIGLAVAKLLRPFGISQLYYCGRSKKAYDTEVGAVFVPFNELLEKSDFVIACCSINPRNHKLFNAEAFKRMKKSAILINTSRGILVDQDALYTALTTGEIYAAGLDVTSPEPLPPDHRLLALSNCTVLPHLGSAAVATRHAMVNLTVRNVLAGLRGEPLPAPVPKL